MAKKIRNTMISGISKPLLAVSILLILFIPAAPRSTPPSSSERMVMATTSIICDFVRSVAGDLWNVECLVEPGVNPHIYEPTPFDMAKAIKASLIFYNGFNLDAWVVKLLRGQNAGKLVRVTEGLEPYVIKIPDGPYAGREDPHMWMDVLLAVKYVENIRDTFIRHDPANREKYIASAAAYIDQLAKLHEWITVETAKIPVEKRVLVTQENAFQYFSRTYGFQVGAYFYSMVTEIEPSPADVVYAINRVKQLGVCVYFVEATLSNRMMLTLIREAGGRLAGVLYADGLGADGTGAETYIGMMRKNVETMVRELMGGC
ncbi:MAG: zinc ABC transporter substrate-binding protein [Candidatus Caldarchaeum sp.]|nr:zinc ABC transporter substrate-binding protein [Candidatus Caldarchaeum sp.]MDW8435405.1 zinc ABC transporter substrate-binding protein [Candidatus Caldarchaeum sp.]